MKRIILFVLGLILVCSTMWAQTPGVKWSKYIKTNPDMEFLYDGQRTSDKGYILVGVDTGGYNYRDEFLWSKSNYGAGWITKLDSTGKTVWYQWLGTYSTALLSVQEVTGGYVTAGYTGAYPDTANYIISKRDGSGNSVWLKTYGGSGEDRAYNVKATTDGGYILAGFSNSSNGDVVKQHSEREAWILKLDANGNKQWAATYGGTAEDTAYAICQMPDGGYLVGGTSSSGDGDVPGNKGSSDGWVFKLDASGTLVWKKNFGGSAQDVLNNIIKNADNTYTLSGYSFSNDGDVSGNHGKADVWVIKIDDAGNLIWSKLFGGSGNDAAFGLQAGITSGSFVTGFTESSDGQVTGLAGGVDCWTLRLDANGNLLWQKSSGTVNNEYAMTVMPTNDVEFAVAGFGYPLLQPWTDLSDGLVIKYSYANTIRGIVFLDANGNSVKDVGENNFDNALVKTQKPGFDLSAMPYNGSFYLDVDTGIYSTSIQLFNPYYVPLLSPQTSTFSTYYNEDSIGFAIQAIPNKKDLFISINAVDPARPGFDVRYRIIYKNIGTVAIPSGTIELTMDSKFSYVSASTAPATISGTAVNWNYSNLNSLDTATILVTLHLAAPPTVNIGDTVRSTVFITPVAGDETPANDTASLKQRVTGSYDPNDKTEANAGIITPAQVSSGDYLNYLIRFQNTGTDTAFNITVRDTLESRLDWNSLEMVAASHPYQLTIEGGNKLSWQFNSIRLPYTGINEPASHGYIAYRIKPVSTVVIGDTIKNSAGIYFDFNLPIITNMDRTVVLILAPLPVTLVSFNAALTGSVVNVTWKTSIEENVNHFEVLRSTNGVDFTTIGTIQPGQTTYLFVDKDPLKGYNYYRLKSVDMDGTTSYSSIVLVNVKNGADIISSLYPNPANGHATLKLQGAVEGNVLVQVLDQQGRLVTTRQFGVQHTGEFKTPLDLGNLSKGSYVLRIVVNDKTYLHKLVVQ
jgi:uncharacterized repeat protein (TIGR01451 family)